MLFDKARIFVQGGGGGDGCRSFRREAHVPRGGPDGGDGGRGGDVVLLCDDSLRDLQSFKRKAHYKAQRAGHGQGALRHGADGDDLVVRVPPGTQVVDWDGTEYDLVVPGGRVVLARGGHGGRGNKRFATATRQAPQLAERGLPGEEGWVELQLKLLADVGLVGLPNAGKSSLLSRLTRAAPKVADYPFTTLEPGLGTLDSDERQLVLADIPGLIEGASDGAGLGHDFLAHVERTRLLVHVLDLAPLDGSDPSANWETIEHELAAHDPRLAAPSTRARALQGRPRRARRGRRGRRGLARAPRAPTWRCSSPPAPRAPASRSSRTSSCAASPSRRRTRPPRSPPRRSSPSIACSVRPPTAAGGWTRWGRGPSASAACRSSAWWRASISTTRRRSRTSSTACTAWA